MQHITGCAPHHLIPLVSVVPSEIVWYRSRPASHARDRVPAFGTRSPRAAEDWRESGWRATRGVQFRVQHPGAATVRPCWGEKRLHGRRWRTLSNHVRVARSCPLPPKPRAPGQSRTTLRPAGNLRSRAPQPGKCNPRHSVQNARRPRARVGSWQFVHVNGFVRHAKGV